MLVKKANTRRNLGTVNERSKKRKAKLIQVCLVRAINSLMFVSVERIDRLIMF